MQYQIVDESGNIIIPKKVVVQGDDVWLFLDDQAAQPDVILQHFGEYYPLSSFHSPVMTGADVPAVLHTVAVQAAEMVGVGMLVGVLALALTGLGVALSRSGGNDDVQTHEPSQPEQVKYPLETKPSTPTISQNPVETKPNISTESKPSVEQPSTPNHPQLSVESKPNTSTKSKPYVEQPSTLNHPNPPVETHPVTPTPQPKPVIHFNSVTEDNILNNQESKSTVTLSGSVNNAPDGSQLN